jgi:hypothetical protein
MAIYDKPVRVLIRDMARELAKSPGDVFSKKQAIEWFRQNYPSIKQSTVSAHLIRFATNAPSRLHYNNRPDEDLFFQVDRSRYRLYDPANDPAPIHSESDVPPGGRRAVTIDDEEEIEEDLTVAPSEFAYESDLRDFLAKNLNTIESGLRLYEDEGITGVEFPVGGRFIDILAVDANGDLVVIELKVSRGYDRVVGQLLRYMGWLERNHAEPTQKVRGVVVAREITEDLKLACSRVDGVSLYEYVLSVDLRKVTLD